MLLPSPKQHFLEEFCSGESTEMLKLGSENLQDAALPRDDVVL